MGREGVCCARGDEKPRRKGECWWDLRRSMLREGG